MTQELTEIKDERVILMKNGLVHWVTPDTWERVQSALQAQSGHTFMKLSELNITINTAEVSGVYFKDQYEDLTKIKRGMYQCTFKKWHDKKESCDCKKRAWEKMRERKQQEQEEEENRPLSAEEKAEVRKRLGIIRKDLEKTGVLKKI